MEVASSLRQVCGRNMSWTRSLVFDGGVWDQELLCGDFISCVFIEVRDLNALTGGPCGRLSSPLNQKANRSSSLCALYTDALTIKCTYNHTPFKEQIGRRRGRKKKREGVKSRYRRKAFSNSLPVDILACTFGSVGTADSPNPADFLPEGLSHCRHCCYCLVPGEKKLATRHHTKS